MTTGEPPEAARLRAALAARGEAVDDVVVTHVSVLARTATRVYKAKRHVTLPFVDLGTADRRRAILERELTLNRRIAPDVYLGVESVTAQDDALVMRRLPDARRLAAIVEHGKGADCVVAVARVLARFHAGAARRRDIDRVATRDAVAALWRAGFVQWRPFVGSLLDADVVATVERRVDEYLAGRARLFDARIAAGRIVDGHGDLLADDVFCLADGPRILDCLEFDDELRCGDVLADVAFLAMDLERLARPDLATRLLREVACAEQDEWPPSLVDHYVAYRAHVRAKVACIKAASDRDEAAAGAARRLLALADDHLERGRVLLVLVGGLPGTGKTTIASQLGHDLDAVHLRSDVVRKQLSGIAPEQHATASFRAGIYDDATTAATYDELRTRARELLALGRSVVLDATWASAGDRAHAAAVASATSSGVIALRCHAPRDVVASRLAARAVRGGDASDADLGVHDAMAARFEPWPDAVSLDTTAADPGAATAAVLAARRRG